MCLAWLTEICSGFEFFPTSRYLYTITNTRLGRRHMGYTHRASQRGATFHGDRTFYMSVMHIRYATIT